MSRITEWEREAKRIGSSAKVFAILEAAEDVADVSHRATPDECRRRLRTLMDAVNAPPNMRAVIEP